MTSGKFVTTVGYEMRFNPALQFRDCDAFVKYMNADQPLRPANMANIVAINQGNKPLTMDQPLCPALTPHKVAKYIKKDHLIVDTRSPSAYGSGHIPGAYNIQLANSEFEQRVGWVTPPDSALILVLENEHDIRSAMVKLAFVGLDRRVKGFLEDGMTSWLREGFSTTTLPQWSVHQLKTELENGMHVLDVRETAEWNAGHIEKAHHLNYKLLRNELSNLPFKPDSQIAVVCAAGMRSSTACSILLQHGYNNVHNVTGGMSVWAAAGLPMVDLEGCPV